MFQRRPSLPATVRVPPVGFVIEFERPHPRVNSTTKVYSRKPYVYAETGTEASPGSGIRPVFLRQTERSGQAQWPGAGVREGSQRSAGKDRKSTRLNSSH